MTDDVTPEEQAAFDAMVRDKQLALISMISLFANIKPGADREEMLRIADSLVPDLARPAFGMGPGALHKASMDVIMHLLGKLAEARGEPVGATWRQAAAELTRQASDG